MKSLLPLSLDFRLDKKSVEGQVSCLYISSKQLEECGRMSTLHFFSEHPYLHLYIIPPMHSDVYKEIKDDIKAWIREKKTKEWLIIYGLCKRELVEEQKINYKTIDKIKRKLSNMGHRSTRLLLAPMVNLKCLRPEKGKSPLEAPINIPKASEEEPKSTISLYKDWDDIKWIMEWSLKDAIEDRFSEMMQNLEKYDQKPIYIRRETAELSHHLKMANLKENLLYLYLKCGLINDCVHGYSELLSGKLLQLKEMKLDIDKKLKGNLAIIDAGKMAHDKSGGNVNTADSSLSWPYSDRTLMGIHPAGGDISEDMFHFYTKFRVSLPTTRVSPFQFRCYILAKQLVALGSANTLENIAKAAEITMEFAMQNINVEYKRVFRKFLLDAIYHIESRLAHSQDAEATTSAPSKKDSKISKQKKKESVQMERKDVSDLASSALLDRNDGRIRCYRCLAFLYKIVYGIKVNEDELVEKEDIHVKVIETEPEVPQTEVIKTEPLDKDVPELEGTPETKDEQNTPTEPAQEHPDDEIKDEDSLDNPEELDRSQGAPEVEDVQSTVPVTTEEDAKAPKPNEPRGNDKAAQQGQTQANAQPADKPVESQTPKGEVLSPTSDSAVTDLHNVDTTISADNESLKKDDQDEDKPADDKVDEQGESDNESATLNATSIETKSVETIDITAADSEGESVSCITDYSLNPSEIAECVEMIRTMSVEEEKPKKQEHLPKFTFEICMPIKVADEKNREDKSGELAPEKSDSGFEPKRDFDDSLELLGRSCKYFTLGGLYRHSVLVDPVVTDVLVKHSTDSEAHDFKESSDGKQAADKESPCEYTHSRNTQDIDPNLAFLEKDTRMMGWTHLWSIVKAAIAIKT
ncbi:hypothetical protein BEWA_035740 [Theileria equi strain WA]|uniref:TRAPPC10/Trs130 N-terminal domain-containing protein n=1 Tax=Theileria equi strain WA TaxID=1537102 RepID=L1LED6_THEEQ|nr:hypothetical protein BEWA_035740 [Theileria equi strain WA]EKX73538.1 hypothetical protein BEWA_035740 [Theileria equi strain WA]|eukprot:XP_004832990.1 hypothetical protein BEWA_035740 [Theileria equi strain WA]